MPSYLDQNTQDLYSIQRMGSAFSDAILGAAAARSKREQMMRQMAIDQAYLNLAQQRQKESSDIAQRRETREEAQFKSTEALNKERAGEFAARTAMQQSRMENAARIGRLAAMHGLPPQALMQMVQDKTSGPQMIGDLRAAGAAPEGEFQMTQPELMQRLAAAVRGGAEGTLATSPSGAAKLALPMMTTPNQIARDPLSPEDVMFTNPQAPPTWYQQQEVLRQQQMDAERLKTERLRQSEIEATTGLRKAQTGAVGKPKALTPKQQADQLLADKIRSKMQGADGATAGIPTFASEQEARGAGHKSGDVVYLQGVGKVQLQ